MNDQLQQALAALLSTTVSGIEAGTAFLQAELPDVIQQLLMWKFAVSALSMLGCLGLAFAIFYLNKKQINYWQKFFAEHTYRDWHDQPELILNVFQIFWFFPLIGLWSLDWLQIWLAPKIYLIEYASTLIK